MLIALCLVWVAAPASAATQDDLLPLPAQMRFQFSYLELPIGTMAIQTQMGNNLSMKGQIEVAGVAQLFSDHKNQMTLDVAGPSPKGYPRIFDTRYHKTGEDERHIRLNYNASGALTDAIHENIYDMDRRGKVSTAQHQASYDPLSIIVMLRQQVYQAVQNKTPTFTTYMYDGKRLHQLNITVYGTRLFEWRGKAVGVQKIGLTRSLAAGQTAKEIKREAGFQLPEAVMYFTSDQQFLPIFAKQNWAFGSFKMVLQ